MLNYLQANVMQDVLSVLLEWISDSHLRPAISDQPTKQVACHAEFIQEKCLKVPIFLIVLYVNHFFISHFFLKQLNIFPQHEGDTYKQLITFTDIVEIMNVFQTFPQLVDILKEASSCNSRFVLPCLQFMYWALLHLEQGKINQVSSSLHLH